MEADLVVPSAAVQAFRRYEFGGVVKMPRRACDAIFAGLPKTEPLGHFLRDCVSDLADRQTLPATKVLTWFKVPDRLRAELPIWFGCSTKSWGYYGREDPPVEPFVRVELSTLWAVHHFVTFAIEWHPPEPKSWRELPSLLNA